MSVPTTQQFFGLNATVLTATTSITATAIAPVLVVRFEDFLGEGWNALVSGDENDPEKWITAIIKKINAFSVANTDDLANVVAIAPIVGLETRNSILKRRYSYSIDIYQADSGSTVPDPDFV